MTEQENPNTRIDLEHDLERLMAHGPDALDVVVFQDIRRMGAPLALSQGARDRVYALALQDLHHQLAPSLGAATA